MWPGVLPESEGKMNSAAHCTGILEDMSLVTTNNVLIKAGNPSRKTAKLLWSNWCAMKQSERPFPGRLLEGSSGDIITPWFKLSGTINERSNPIDNRHLLLSTYVVRVLLCFLNLLDHLFFLATVFIEHYHRYISAVLSWNTHQPQLCLWACRNNDLIMTSTVLGEAFYALTNYPPSRRSTPYGGSLSRIVSTSRRSMTVFSPCTMRDSRKMRDRFLFWLAANTADHAEAFSTATIPSTINQRPAMPSSLL